MLPFESPQYTQLSSTASDVATIEEVSTGTTPPEVTNVL